MSNEDITKEQLIFQAKKLFHIGYTLEKPNKKEVRERAEIRAKFSPEEFEKIEREIVFEYTDEKEKLWDAEVEEIKLVEKELEELNASVEKKFIELFKNKNFRESLNFNLDLIVPHCEFIKKMFVQYLFMRNLQYLYSVVFCLFVYS